MSKIEEIKKELREIRILVARLDLTVYYLFKIEKHRASVKRCQATNISGDCL